MVATDPGDQVTAIFEITNLRTAIANTVAANPSAATPSLVALDTALANFDNDLVQADGSIDSNLLDADTNAIDSTGTANGAPDEMAWDEPPVKGEGTVKIDVPLGGKGKNTGTYIPTVRCLSSFGEFRSANLVAHPEFDHRERNCHQDSQRST